MSSRIRALVNVERPVVIIVDDTVTPAEEYLEIEFETHAEANAAVEQLNQILKTAKGITVQGEIRGRPAPEAAAPARVTTARPGSAKTPGTQRAHRGDAADQA